MYSMHFIPFFFFFLLGSLMLFLHATLSVFFANPANSRTGWQRVERSCRAPATSRWAGWQGSRIEVGPASVARRISLHRVLQLLIRQLRILTTSPLNQCWHHDELFSGRARASRPDATSFSSFSPVCWASNG